MVALVLGRLELAAAQELPVGRARMTLIDRAERFIEQHIIMKEIEGATWWQRPPANGATKMAAKNLTQPVSTDRRRKVRRVTIAEEEK